MKDVVRAWAWVLVLGFVVAGMPALADQHEDGQLIESEKGAWEAWKNGDRSYFESNVAADGMMILGDGQLLTKSEIVEQVGSCEVAGYSLSDFRVHAVGAETRILTYTAEQDAVCEGERIPASLTVSSTWAFRDGTWMNVHYQETVRMEAD